MANVVVSTTAVSSGTIPKRTQPPAASMSIPFHAIVLVIIKEHLISMMEPSPGLVVPRKWWALKTSWLSHLAVPVSIGMEEEKIPIWKNNIFFCVFFCFVHQTKYGKQQFDFDLLFTIALCSALRTVPRTVRRLCESYTSEMKPLVGTFGIITLHHITIRRLSMRTRKKDIPDGKYSIRWRPPSFALLPSSWSSLVTPQICILFVHFVIDCIFVNSPDILCWLRCKRSPSSVWCAGRLGSMIDRKEREIHRAYFFFW